MIGDSFGGISVEFPRLFSRGKFNGGVRYAADGRTQSNAYPLFRTADLFAAQRQSHFDPSDGKDLARPSSYL